MAGANLALRFLLELAALAATAYWGFETGSGATRWLLAVAAPAAVAVVWGLFVSPKATFELPRLARLAVELAVLGAAAAALAHAGEGTLAVVFALVFVVSGAVNFLRG